MSETKAINPKVKKNLKEYEESSGIEYATLLERFNTARSELKELRPGKTGEFYDSRAMFKVKQSLRGRPGVRTVKIEGVVLGATDIIDIAGGRRFNVINTIKDHLQKGNTGAIEEMLNSNEAYLTPLTQHKESIDAELASLENAPDDRAKETIQGRVNTLRRQEADGSVEDQGEMYVIVPLETRQFFDDAGTRSNPNYGKPVNYADRRRMYIIGRTVEKKEVSLPKLLVIEARLDQCYNWEANHWDIIDGFTLRVISDDEEKAYLRTTRQTAWKVKDESPELLKELGIEDLNDEESRCHLLLSAPEEFQLTISAVYGMYGKKEWKELMTNWDRFHIIVADLLNKSDITLGFRNQYLGEGDEPDSMEYGSKTLNFWVNEGDEDPWSKFGVQSRVIFGGMLQDRQIWDSEESAMSDETAPCMDVAVFVPIPEYKEEPT